MTLIRQAPSSWLLTNIIVVPILCTHQLQIPITYQDFETQNCHEELLQHILCHVNCCLYYKAGSLKVLCKPSRGCTLQNLSHEGTWSACYVPPWDGVLQQFVPATKLLASFVLVTNPAIKTALCHLVGSVIWEEVSSSYDWNTAQLRPFVEDVCTAWILAGGIWRHHTHCIPEDPEGNVTIVMFYIW